MHAATTLIPYAAPTFPDSDTRLSPSVVIAPCACKTNATNSLFYMHCS